jgi:DNA-binding response OmpR family regulator
MKVLLIEDRKGLMEALTCMLVKNGYEVSSAMDGEQGYNMAIADDYDIVVLDRLLPSWDGIKVLTTFRKQGFNTPVLLLTGMDSPQNLVEGLDAGADDYMVKPFQVGDFLARIRTLIRRKRKKLIGDTVLQAAGIMLDLQNSSVVKGNEVIGLSDKEFLLLELLVRNCGQVLSKDFIYEKIWGNSSNSQLTCIGTYIYFLRKKLNNPHIHTIRGKGYLLQE